MGIIDSIKAGLGIGGTGDVKRTSKAKKGATIDTTDKISISGKKEDVGAPFNKKATFSPKEKLSPKELEKRLKDTIHRMTAIARGFGGDFKMDVKEGKNWAYHFDTNSITYPRQDLIDKPPDYAMGVILHELSHRRYSRWVVEPEMEKNEPFLLLNNAIEDPRVNNITISRYAGAKDFFKKIYDHDLFTPEFGYEIKQKIIEQLKKNGVPEDQAKQIADSMGQVPKHIQFGMGIIYDWYTGGKMDPRIKDKDVQEALKKAAPYYRKAFELKRDVMKKDLTPAEINQQAIEAYRIVKEKVWPIYQELVKKDENNLANKLSKQGKAQQSQGKKGKKGSQGQASQGASGAQGQQSQSSQGTSSGSQGQSQSAQGVQGQGSSSGGAKQSSQGVQKQQAGGSQTTQGQGSKQTSQGQKPYTSQGAGSSKQDKQAGGTQKAGSSGTQKSDQNAEGSQAQGSGGSNKAQGNQQADSKGQGSSQGVGQNEQAQGTGSTGSGGMDPEKAKEIAKKVIKELDKELSGSKFEEKDKTARRQNRPKAQGSSSQGSGKSGKSGKSSKGQKGSQAQGSQGNQKGKSSQQAQGQQGNQSGQGDQGSQGNQNAQGSQGNQGGQGGPQANGSQAQGSQGTDQSQGGQNPNNTQSQGGNGGQTSDIDLPSIEELLQKKMELEAKLEAMRSGYDKYVYEVAEYSSQLAGELKNFMHEHEKPKYVGGFRTGKKLDLRRAMQAEAKYSLTGEFDDRIWMRREKPTKRDHKFIFVLDESGSMRGGEKWENALKGLVLCQEALDEMEIDFGVIGFSDYPQIHKDISEKFTEDFRDVELNSINASASGGTNDADAIKSALEMLRIQEPDTQKTIVVITDGEGKSYEVKKLIEEAEEAGIRIIGVGIGEGVSAVEDVYKYHVRVDEISDLPEKLADIIREQIENAYGDV